MVEILFGPNLHLIFNFQFPVKEAVYRVDHVRLPLFPRFMSLFGRKSAAKRGLERHMEKHTHNTTFAWTKDKYLHDINVVPMVLIYRYYKK